MPRITRPTRRPAVVLVGLAVALVAAVATGASARDPGRHHRAAHHELAKRGAHRAQARDDGPRNPAGEAATGDTRAMLAVVQDVVDCLRAKGFHPGDPQPDGRNVVIADWDPAPGSAAWRADEECAFPVR
jgi:hypothetical protein